MKRLWFAAGIAVFLIVFAMFSLLYTANLSNRVEGELASAVHSARNEDWEQAVKRAQTAYDDFSGQRDVMNVFYHHDTLEGIEILLASLCEISQYKDSELFDVKCSEAIKRLVCLRECDNPVFGNIL